MPDEAGVTFDRGRWLALVAAIGDHPLVAPLEVERIAAEFTEEERAAYEAAGEGFGWLFGSEALGWFPRHPGRHTRAGPNGESVEVDPPRRTLGTRPDGTPIEVIATDALPHAGVQGLLRRGVIRELEPEGAGVFGAMVSLNAAPFPWRVGRVETRTELAGAWLLDAKGGRIAWLPKATDAHAIARDANAARDGEADVYRIGAMRESLSRLKQVVYPDNSYQPSPKLGQLHQDAEHAVNRLLAALPSWANSEAPPPATPAEQAPEEGTAPAPPAGERPVRFWPVVLAAGILFGWLLRGWW